MKPQHFSGRESQPRFELLESRVLLSSGPIPIDDYAGLPQHSSPPDPICAAGPDNLLAMVNYRLGLYQKDGTLIEDTTFGEFYGAVDHGGQIFDPWVVYDQYSNRYVAMAAERELGDSADEAWFLIGVSTSSSVDDFDVAAGDSDNDWWVYSVNASRNFGNGPTWADYPKLAADADSIYITSNNLTFAHDTTPAYWGGLLVTRLNKIPMLSGTAVAPVQIDGEAAGLHKTTQPAQSVGRSASQPQLFVDPASWNGTWCDGIRVWELDDSNNLSVSPTLGSQFQTAGSHSPQGDTHAQIIIGGTQLMNAVWRDDSLWTAHAVSNVVDPNRTFDSGTVNLSIPDLGTRTSTLSVSGLDGLVMDVNVTVNITHPFDADLDAYLISPSGTRIELFTDVGDNGDNFTNTKLDDTARDGDGNPRPITGGTAPFTGSFRPEGYLSELEGEEPNGTWTLEVTDDAGGDVGTLVSWSLEIAHGDAVVRWYEIDTTGGTYSLTQSGDIDPGRGIHTYYPAIGVDAAGNMAVTYTQSSPFHYPDMMVAGRRATDPYGYTTPGVTVKASASAYGQPQEVGALRWGDYGGIALDPTDGKTFYTFHEYAVNPTTWGTWWGVFTFETGGIEGTKYEDFDGNGQQDADEPGLSGREIYLDLNNNGALDEHTTTVASADVPTDLPDLRSSTSRLEVSGLAGLTFDVNVTLNITHTYDADLDVYLYSPWGTRVELFTDVGGAGNNFTNTTLDDEAGTPITSAVAPFTGTFRPEGSLSAFDHEDPNGTWTLEITDGGAGDVGRLDDWSITIAYGDPVAVTGGDGGYIFTGLEPGDYVVREVLPTGWMHVTPASGWQTATVSPGQITGDVDFGNARPAKIMGRRFHDFDGDGDESAGDTGLPGRMVYLDYNMNGQHDAGEPDMLTASNGSYQFQDVLPGSYIVREEPVAGWIQTAPANDVLYGVAPFMDSELVVIDLETFGGIAVGPTGQTKMVGLASDGAGMLYSIPAAGYFNRWLYSVSPITGQATELFDLGITSLNEGGLALAPDGKTIYAARTYPSFDGNLPPELIRINLGTQTTTVLGQLTIAGSPFPSGTQVDGLAFRGNALYGLVTEAGGNPDDHLIIINTSTLAVTDVGATGEDFSVLAGLAYDPRRDVFYASGSGQGALLNLWEISPQTAQASRTESTGLLNLSGLTYGTSRGTPLAGAHVVFAASGSTVFADFGDALSVEIHGSKWHDENGNGRQDPGEPGLADWDVYLDENGNDILDDTLAGFDSADAPKPLPDAATTISTLSVKDVVGRITDAYVHLGITHTCDGDLEAVLVSPAGTRVQLFFRVGGDGDDFTGTTLDDEAATPISSGSPPFSGSFRPAEALSALDGEDPNGIWTLEVTDHATGDVGTLDYWSLSLRCAERSARTDPDGRYEFTNLNPGSYDIREVPQAGWVRTAPGAVPVLIDGFEDGNLVEYTEVVPGSGGFINPFAAHDGDYGAVGMDWMYRDDPVALVERGDVISAWVRFANNATGGASLGFGMSATQWYSLHLQPEYNSLDLYQSHETGFYLFGTSEQVYLSDKWYRVEVVWGTSGAIEGRLYDSDGVTLLNTVTGYDTTIASGGIGFAGSGTGSVRQFDTITRWRDGAHHVVVTSGGAANDVNFGNAQPGLIQGTKYHDRNGSGTRDGGEEGLPGWLMYVDADDDLLIDSNSDIVASAGVPRPLPDMSTTVSGLRVHQMSGLILDVNVGLNISHTYDWDLKVYLVGPLGTRVELFKRVGGDGDNFTNTILDDQAADPITSGSAPFTGTFRPEGLLSAFNGQDPNGIWRLEVTDGAIGDTGTLNNWWLQIWHGDPFVLTDANGEYSFTGLTPGEYVTRELPGFAFGWLQTAPLMGPDYTPVTSGQGTGGVDFGNALPGSVSGFKYEDADGSTDHTPGESKLPNWTIFLDADANGVLDEDRQPFASEDVPRPIPDEGTVVSALPVTGLAGRILDVDVHLDITHTFDGDLEVYLYSPAGTQVELFTAVGGSGQDFAGTVLDDEAGTPITAGTAPFGDRFRPEGLLSALDGERVNGTWVLEVRDTVAGDVGTLNSWSIDLTYGDPSAETDAGGDYALTHLMPGECVLREVQQDGWVQTEPASGVHVFGLASDDDLSNVNFGNQRQSPPPARPDLLPDSDTGVPDDDLTRLDNSTPSKVLEFEVGETVPGATVTIHADGAPIGSAVAAGTTTTVTTNGSEDLVDGMHTITARQTVPASQPSADSPGLTVWIDTLAPTVTAVGLNDRPGRTVSDIEPSGIGVQTVEVVFSEAVDLGVGAVTLETVTFPGGAEVVGDTLALADVTGTGTDTIVIQVQDAWQNAVDTWVKVTLGSAGIADPAGNGLDGNPRTDSSGLGYIRDADLDLPTGDGVIDDGAIFYVGSLRGDTWGVGFWDPGPDRQITLWDINSFTSKYQESDPDVDLWGLGFWDPEPDGDVTLWDINAFTTFYQDAVANGTHLDELPTLAAPSAEPALAAILPAEAVALPARGPTGIFSLSATQPVVAAGAAIEELRLLAASQPLPGGEAGLYERQGETLPALEPAMAAPLAGLGELPLEAGLEIGLTASEDAKTPASLYSGPSWARAMASAGVADSALVPDDGLVDLLALSAVALPLGA